MRFIYSNPPGLRLWGEFLQDRLVDGFLSASPLEGMEFATWKLPFAVSAVFAANEPEAFAGFYGARVMGSVGPSVA